MTAINSAEGDQNNFQTVGLEDTFTVPSNSAIHNKVNITYIAYCWAEIEGYSKFGMYKGNGGDNGTFVYFGI